MNVRYFESAASFRLWLERHHGEAEELWVGYYRKSSGKPSLTWPESVDEALCFGWIDGLRRSIDGSRYTIRFSRRRKGSVWSAVNIRRARELTARGRMTAAGAAAFEARKENRSGIYSYEQRRERLDEPYASRFGRNRAASKFFDSQPSAYRRAAVWWVVSAKQEATRSRRLETLVRLSAAGQRIPQFTRRKPAR